MPLNKRAREKSKAGIEVWRDVPGYDGMYRVSNLGRVKARARVVPHKTVGKLTLPARELKPTLEKSGYMVVRLSKEGKGTNLRVHCLMTAAFDGPMPEKYDVTRHKDDIKSNNVLHNLRYGTFSNNVQDALKNGRTYRDPNKPVGVDSHRAVLTEKQALYILKFEPKKRGDLTKLANRLGITPTTVTDIRAGRSWTHLK